MSNREIFNRYPFDMEIPDQPYIDNFSKGLTHPAIYTGVRFLKFRIENGTGLLKEEVANGHTLEEVQNLPRIPDRSCHLVESCVVQHDQKHRNVLEAFEDIKLAVVPRAAP